MEVWRERAFEIVLDGIWVTGVFDRVLVVKDPSGRAISAAVYDFKTDRNIVQNLARATERHAGQITLYRRVVAVLTGLPEKMIKCILVFTEGGLAVEVPLKN